MENKNFEMALEIAAAAGDVKLLSDAYYSAQGIERIKVENALLKAMDTLKAKGMYMEIFDSINKVKDNPTKVQMPDKAMQRGIESLAKLGAALQLLNLIRNQDNDIRMKTLAQKNLPKSICALEKKERLGYMIDMSARRDFDTKMLKSIELSCISVVRELGKKGNFNKLKSAISNRNSAMAIREAAEKEMQRKKYYSDVINNHLMQRIADDKRMRFNGKKEIDGNKTTLPS